MMKKHILILVSIFLCNFVVAQTEYDRSILVGKYEGKVYDSKTLKTSDEVSISGELFNDFTFEGIIKTNEDETPLMKIPMTPMDVIERDGFIRFPFKFPDTYGENLILEVILVSPNSPRQGVLIRFPFTAEEHLMFWTNRAGGNPKYPGLVTDQKK